jgi:hypothetical protein
MSNHAINQNINKNMINKQDERKNLNNLRNINQTRFYL